MKLTPSQANKLFVILIIVVFIFILFTGYFIISNIKALTQSPLEYSAEKYSLGDCSCYCYDNVTYKSLYFNDTSVSIELQRR